MPNKNTEKPDYLEHRKRRREAYLKNGFTGWHDYEILEFLLFYAIPQEDTKPIAKRLLEKFKTLDAILNADIKELQTIKRIGPHSATLFKVVKEISTIFLVRQMKHIDVVSSPSIVVEYLRLKLLKSREEKFIVLFLNNQNHVLNSEILQTGTVNKSVIYPRTIVEKALKYNATGIILAHNHPSGTLEPSKEDITISNKLKEACKNIDINLLDHIIVTDSDYISLKTKNLI